MMNCRLLAASISLGLALVGCAPTVMQPDLLLADRFDLVAFRDEGGQVVDELYRWEWPLTVHYVGPAEYKPVVLAHMERLGALTGLPTGEDDMFAKMRIEIGHSFPDYGQLRGYECAVQYGGNGARVFILDSLPPRTIRQCIVQEMTQALGLGGDLDDWNNYVSRSDTVFASFQVADDLTEQDIALIRILYDPRLRSGLSRQEAMPIVRQIVLEMEAEQAVGTQ